MLYREPMWLKSHARAPILITPRVSVLYREPMWLKSTDFVYNVLVVQRFSALP